MSVNLGNYSIQIKDIEPGETLRLNHTGCEAGVDSRRRLYVSRPEANPELVIGYCHNCQQKGFLTTTGHIPYRDKKHNPKPTTTLTSDVITPPHGMVSTLDDWTVAAQAWAMHNRLSQADLDAYHIALDPSTNRVYLPRYDIVIASSVATVGELMGYQLRKVEDNDGPKYLTARKTEDIGYTKVYTKIHGVSKTIIVEDLVSAIHIASAFAVEPVRIVVNYGTKINLEALNSMTTTNGVRWVWLDNDSEHVIEQGKIMARTMDLLHGGRTLMIDDHSDPKHYNPLQIREALDG